MAGATRTVDEYIGGLSVEQQDVIATIRDLILRNLPKGYQESMTWGIPTYEVPLERYPDTYNGKPLGYAALAVKKNYYTIHLMSVYADPELLKWLSAEFKRRGKKLNMGKGCLRFKRLDDLPLDVMSELISKTSLEDYVARVNAGWHRQARERAQRSSTAARRPARRTKTAAKKPSRKSAKPAARRTSARKRPRAR